MPYPKRRSFRRRSAYIADRISYKESLAAYWSLQILVDLNGVTGLMGYPNNLTADGTILNTIGLGYLEDKDMKLAEFKRELNDRLDDQEKSIPEIEGAPF